MGRDADAIRAHYSSPDGVAMAYEGFSYWQDWDRYLGVEDEAGLTRYWSWTRALLAPARDQPRLQLLRERVAPRTERADSRHIESGPDALLRQGSVEFRSAVPE
jgi:sarcosine oxidase, subunit beta